MLVISFLETVCKAKMGIVITYGCSADGTGGGNGSAIRVNNVLPWEGGVDWAPSDVREDDIGVGGVGLNISGSTGSTRACSTADTWLAWISVKRIGGVEPEHVDVVIVPDGHDENAVLEGLSLLGESTLDLILVAVAESSLLGSAEGVVDRVASNAWDLG